MRYLVSLLPIILYIGWVWSIDRFSLVGVKQLAQMIASGLLAALLCYILAPFSLHLSPFSFLEDIVKAIPLLVLACRRRMTFFVDSVILGAAVGGGFSTLENLLYLLNDDQLTTSTALFRGLEVSLLHMGCSAMQAVALMFLVRQVERHRSRLPVGATDVAIAILLLIASSALHLAHNTLHFNPFLQTVAALCLMALLLFATYRYDLQQIHRWLDRSLTKQLHLLRSFRQGTFHLTPIGGYLYSVRNAFPPAVFTNILNYVQLHTELQVIAKSRFIALEAGLDYPIDKARATAIHAKYSEYQHLERSLGPSVRAVLAPFLKFYPADRRVLTDLLKKVRL